MDTISARIQQALDQKGWKQADLVKATGIGKASISTYLAGEYEPKQKNLFRLARALNVSEAWLMGYDVPMERYQPPHEIPSGFEAVPDLSTIPLVGQIACGEPILAEENVEDMVSTPARWHADFALTCKGDSMAPTIQDGDLVAIRIQPEVETGEIAAVRIGSEATLKRVYLHPDYIELRPENPAFESIIRRRDAMNDVRIEGKAVGLCRGL